MKDCLPAPSPADVAQAASRIEGFVNRTPVHTSRWLDGHIQATAAMKCENFQRVGAFKMRGATNAILKLSEQEREAGVLAYSSGNHAAAVALASALLGCKATIIMPSDAPLTKLKATKGYLARGGGELVVYHREETTREELGARYVKERGLTLIPPYDHPDVIAGQGTAAMELFEQAGELDVLLVCCGGGGLLSGCALAAKAACPACQVIGIEPELADDATRSFRTGRLHTVSNPKTIADGARTPSLGSYTFPLVLENVSDMLTVSEADIASAVLLAFSRLKLVVEPAGALALAGLLRYRERFADKRVGVMISGGNIDPAMITELIGIAGVAELQEDMDV